MKILFTLVWIMAATVMLGASSCLAEAPATYQVKMETTKIATRGPPGGQYSPEHYFEEVLEDARSLEAQWSKNTMFQ